jgi:antitoxin HigA-1
MPRIRTHPGEVLREDYLKPLGLSARALAEALYVPSNRISEILRERRDVTADTARRLARYFGTTPDFWLNLQTQFDLGRAPSREIERIEPIDTRAFPIGAKGRAGGPRSEQRKKASRSLMSHAGTSRGRAF